MSKIEVNQIDTISGSSTLLVGPSAATKLTFSSTLTVDFNVNSPGVTLGADMKNTPAFMAYKNADQTLSDAANTKITFPATYLNVGSYFDTSNSRFTPLVGGKYYLQCTVTYDCGSANAYNSSELKFYVNGSTTYWEQATIPNNNGNRFSEKICGIIDFNGSTDYVEVYGAHDVSTGTTTAKGHATNYRAFSYWSGFKLIGA